MATRALLLATAAATAVHAGHPPSVCQGWPAGDSAVISETNYSNPDLPDLLTFLNGTKVTSAGAAWQERRAEIKFLLHKYLYGTLPDENPPLVAVNASAQVKARGGGSSQEVRLTFLVLGRTNVTIEVEVLRPAGSGPFPLFLTQTNHRRWGLKAVARGFAACIYPGADVNDQSLEFRAAYRNASTPPTWGTILSRSWLASRALDYLLDPTRVDFIDPKRVGISGHSRNGKQAMLAGAFDERVSTVVSSSSGSPGMCPYRTTSANTFAEGPSDAPPQWWIPELSCFKGWEHRLPIDSHGLLALIAPRHMMAATAWTDGCEPTWAVERAYKAGREVYRMLGAADALRIKYRPGQHHGFLDVDSYFDWFNFAGGVAGFTAGMFPELLLQDFDWRAWSRHVPPALQQPPAGASRLDAIKWGLGPEPTGILSPGGHYGEQCEPGNTADGCFIAKMMTHGRFSGHSSNISRAEVNFGEYVSASVYFKCSSFESGTYELLGSCAHPPGNLPVVVWMHPLSYISGYNEGYTESESGTGIYFDLAEAGFAVIAFDAASFGTRGYEFNGALGGAQGGDGTPLFYRRYPTWSLLGKIVHDGLAALDLAQHASDSARPAGDPPSGLPSFDASRIFVVGYDMGGRAALYMGALDAAAAAAAPQGGTQKRVKGIVSINGWTPMREDTNFSSTGGIRRLWDWHALQPALGWFDGKEAELPYDMDDVIVEASGATEDASNQTKILIYQQELDRENDYVGVKASVAKAVAAGAHVELLSAPTVNMLNDAAHSAVIDWLREQAGLTQNTSAGDCGRGLPENMTPLRLVSCSDPRLENHTRFEMNSADSTLRLSRCSTHACAIDCSQAGGCGKAGTLAEPEKMILSGVLPATPNLINFHFSFDDKAGTIAFNFNPATATTKEEGAPVIHKCFEGSDSGGQIMLAKCSGAATQKWAHASAAGQFKWGGGGGDSKDLCLGWVESSQRTA